ncbi:MAG: GPW/gp25 family protein [Saprospiraceae bacterium]
MTLPFLGRGWSFPPTFNENLNSVDMLEEEADIVSSLEILLTTAPGERVMLPEFGCNLEELLFESLDNTLKTLMINKIEAAILYYESRIDVETVKLDTKQENESLILIEIVYRVRSTNSRFNFVFPFYKEEGTDINLTTTINLLPATT